MNMYLRSKAEYRDLCFVGAGQLEDTLITDKVITKSDVRDRLVFLSSFNSDARPSRGGLRQVFNFFNPIGP